MGYLDARMDPIERTSISTLFKLAAIFIPLSSHYEETKLPAETVQWKVPVTQTTHVPGFGTVFNERERMKIFRSGSLVTSCTTVTV